MVYKGGVCVLKERLLKTDTGYLTDGIREQVLNDGRRIVEFYKADVRDSVFLSYYPSGILQLKMNVYRGNVIGPMEGYSSNGKLEAFAWFTDPVVSGRKPKADWTIAFDSTRNVIRTDGHPVLSAQMSHIGLEGKDSVALAFLFASAPDSMNMTALISMQHQGQRTVDTFSSFIELPAMKMKVLRPVFPYYEDAEYSSIYLLLDKRNNILVSDTVIVEHR
ncbi:MAG: hypothetical protein KF744_11610 [Taibaiella sp.]|nr:hypothetical protein [Taibaiella sp.]